jgi:hypothetical protein
MNAHNPYAPSRASLKHGQINEQLHGGVTAWRDKRVMVMLPDAAIPQRCVKCNGAVDEPTKTRQVYWHNPWLYLLLLFNVIIFAIVASIVRKKATVAAGLCTAHKERRRTMLTIMWVGTLGGIVLAFLSLGSEIGPWGAFTSILLSVGSIIFGMIAGRIVTPTRIDKDYVRLKGCGEAYLDTLPQFPG